MEHPLNECDRPPTSFLAKVPANLFSSSSSRRAINKTFPLPPLDLESLKLLSGKLLSGSTLVKPYHGSHFVTAFLTTLTTSTRVWVSSYLPKAIQNISCVA
ncbi:unnamed protein product [Ceratitis capitata]|uniref:(Mediterranean fruit fly) hypothetical protein n=1 Tax=Ceratitis capitata TaxID=7213 RepID=A0A811V7P3_CERCA|nr:unnamed protein product [Ceratitis capitata]